MYVCLCKSVTDSQIRRAAEAGIDDLYELREQLGVASGCGSCAGMAEEILAESRSSRCQPKLFVPALA